MLCPGFIRCKQGEFTLEDGIIIQVRERNIVKIEILTGRQLVIQVEFALAEITAMLRKMIPQ